MLKRTFDPWLPHRYVVYARMSSDQQNPRSPEQQFETVGRLIERLGRPWVHVADYRDDGISGRYLAKRPGFQRMLADIRSGAAAVDLILVDTLERFGRVEELESIRRELHNRCGVLVLTADSGFADPTTSAGRAMAAFESMRAVEDGRVKAHNVLRGKRDAARRGRWPGGPPPFGMRLRSVLVDRHGRQEVDHCVLEHDPETAWVVRRLFALARETGFGSNRLARASTTTRRCPPDSSRSATAPSTTCSATRSTTASSAGRRTPPGSSTTPASSSRTPRRTCSESPATASRWCRGGLGRGGRAAACPPRGPRARPRAARDGDGKQIEPAAPGLVLSIC